MGGGPSRRAPSLLLHAAAGSANLRRSGLPGRLAAADGRTTGGPAGSHRIASAVHPPVPVRDGTPVQLISGLAQPRSCLLWPAAGVGRGVAVARKCLPNRVAAPSTHAEVIFVESSTQYEDMVPDTRQSDPAPRAPSWVDAVPSPPSQRRRGGAERVGGPAGADGWSGLAPIGLLFWQWRGCTGPPAVGRGRAGRLALTPYRSVRGEPLDGLGGRRRQSGRSNCLFGSWKWGGRLEIAEARGRNRGPAGQSQGALSGRPGRRPL